MKQLTRGLPMLQNRRTGRRPSFLQNDPNPRRRPPPTLRKWHQARRRPGPRRGETRRLTPQNPPTPRKYYRARQYTRVRDETKRNDGRPNFRRFGRVGTFRRPGNTIGPGDDRVRDGTKRDYLRPDLRRTSKETDQLGFVLHSVKRTKQLAFITG